MSAREQFLKLTDDFPLDDSDMPPAKDERERVYRKLLLEEEEGKVGQDGKWHPFSNPDHVRRPWGTKKQLYFHLFAWLWNVVNWIWLFSRFHSSSKLAHMRHLTVWSLTNQCLFWTFALVFSVLAVLPHHHDRYFERLVRLRYHYDRWWVLSICVATFVGAGFYLAVFPGELSKYPHKSWEGIYMDHALHFVTTITMWTELWVVHHRFNSARKEIGVISVFVGAYFIINNVAFALDKEFPYPIQDFIYKEAGLFVVVVVEIVSAVLIVYTYFPVRSANNKLWEGVPFVCCTECRAKPTDL